MKTLWIVIVGIVLVVSASVWGQNIQPIATTFPLLPEDAPIALPEYEVPPTLLFSIPIGSDGISYSGVDIEEMIDWGPSSIKVDSDGVIWIADAVAHRLVGYAVSGRRLYTVNLSDKILTISDFEIADDVIWVADMSAIVPTVVQMNRSGVEIARYDLPRGSESFFGGIRLMPSGRPAVFVAQTVLGLSDTKATSANLPGHVWEDVRSDSVNQYPPIRIVNHKGWDTPLARYFSFEASNFSRLETFAGDVSIGYLNVDMHGNHYVESTEAVGGEYMPIYDRVVRRYDASLRRAGVARFPQGAFIQNVSYPIAIAPNGDVIVMITHRDRIDVMRLELSRRVGQIEFEEEIPDDVWMGEHVSADKACISRTAIDKNAIAYRTNRTHLSSSAISGSCSGRQKPRYLGSAGYYDSVAYDWGGFDSVGMFNQAMTTSSHRAGDINSTVESCSRGVDCSGFVSRVWGLTVKHSTSTLRNVSYAVSKAQLKMGDILNRSGDHVVLFMSNCTTGGSAGYLVYEATVYGSFDRVVRHCRRTSDFSSYEARRYNNVCS